MYHGVHSSNKRATRNIVCRSVAPENETRDVTSRRTADVRSVRRTDVRSVRRTSAQRRPNVGRLRRI